MQSVTRPDAFVNDLSEGFRVLSHSFRELLESVRELVLVDFACGGLPKLVYRKMHWRPESMSENTVGVTANHLTNRQTDFIGGRSGEPSDEPSRRFLGRCLGHCPRALAQRRRALGQRRRALGRRLRALGQRPRALGQRPRSLLDGSSDGSPLRPATKSF